MKFSNFTPNYFVAFIATAFMTQSLASSISAEPKSSADSKTAAAGKNPLLSESSPPYHLPPFDKIKDDQFIPAMEAGMREHLQQAEKIATNPEQPTFENTIVAMERSGR